jgi:hypothetical protein
MPPEVLMEPPNNLVLIEPTENLKLSELVDSVKINYSIAYGNKTKLEVLQSWIVEQKKLFENKK